MKEYSEKEDMNGTHKHRQIETDGISSRHSRSQGKVKLKRRSETRIEGSHGEEGVRSKSLVENDEVMRQSKEQVMT